MCILCLFAQKAIEDHKFFELLKPSSSSTSSGVSYSDVLMESNNIMSLFCVLTDNF